jgi:hypothetical protein
MIAFPLTVFHANVFLCSMSPVGAGRTHGRNVAELGSSSTMKGWHNSMDRDFFSK